MKALKILSCIGLCLFVFSFSEAGAKNDKPTLVPDAGVFEDPVSVEIENNIPDGTVYYTLDGSTPTVDSAIYEAPIEIETDTMIKAVAVDDEGTQSKVVSGVYAIESESTACITCDGILSTEGRWCDQGDGTVKDMTTGLVWLQDASCMGPISWPSVLKHITVLRHGEFSLQDGSGWGDWRLPTIHELVALSHGEEAVTSQNMRSFTGVFGFPYLSRTLDPSDEYLLNIINMYDGSVTSILAEGAYHNVWPVRIEN